MQVIIVMKSESEIGFIFFIIKGLSKFYFTIDLFIIYFAIDYYYLFYLFYYRYLPLFQ